MGVLAGKLSAGRKGIVRRQPASVRRPHRGGDEARPPAAAVVYLDALRTAPSRLQHTQFAKGTYGTRKLLKLGALVPPACGVTFA